MDVISVRGTSRRIDWDALARCARECKQNILDSGGDYTQYLKDAWGIDHGVRYIRIVDEQKYMMFLLRWS